MAAINIVAYRTEKAAAAKSAKPISDVARAADRAEPKLSELKRADGTIKSACDFNAEDPGDVAEEGDSDEDIRHRIFMHRASEALRHAEQNGFEKAATKEITKEIIQIALAAAEAWSSLTSELQRRFKNGE